jgi:hypothetical protein
MLVDKNIEILKTRMMRNKKKFIGTLFGKAIKKNAIGGREI